MGRGECVALAIRRGCRPGRAGPPDGAPAGADHSAHRALDHEQRVNRRPDRDQREARFAVAILILGFRALGGSALGEGPGLCLRRVAGRRQAVAHGRGERENRQGGQGRARQNHIDRRAPAEPPGRPEHGVADDPAKAGRQRPTRGRRQQRGEAGCGCRPEQRETEPRPRTGEPLFRQKPPAPKGWRRQRDDAGHADELHGDIGADRAGLTQPIVNRGRCRVIEAGVLDRPAQQGERTSGDSGEDRSAQHLGRPAPRDFTHRVGQVVEQRECRGTHCATLGRRRGEKRRAGPDLRRRELTST